MRRPTIAFALAALGLAGFVARAVRAQDEEPAAEKPAAEEPAGKEAAVEEPAAEEAAAEEAPPIAEAADEEGVVPGADPIPTKLARQPQVVSHFAGAKPLRLDEVTDIDHAKGATSWFRVDVPPGERTVLRVTGLNTWGAAVTVFDASGAPFSAEQTRHRRPSAWHGVVPPGAYYVRIAPPEGEEPEKLSPAEQAERKRAKLPPGLRPAMLVLLDPQGPGGSPRRAAQLGLDYLEVDAPAWQNEAACNGCHMQAQALMGMALAKKSGYRVVDRSAQVLGEFIAAQEPELYAALAIRYFVSGFAPDRAPVLRERALALTSDEPDAAELDSGNHPPIQAGRITGTAMGIQVLSEAVRQGPAAQVGDIRKRRDAALAWLRAAGPESREGEKAPEFTVQDRAMKIIAFADAGLKGPPLAQELAGLLRMQNSDGGFGESPGGGPSNAYGTGQALYAMRLAGLASTDAAFSRAVKWLVLNQVWNGTWPLRKTECQSDIAHAMWAVIGLAGGLEATLPMRVTATVRDARGAYLTDLKAGDFTVLEDGARQAITRFQATTGDLQIVLLIDTSGSIKPALPQVVQAAKSFLGLMAPGDRVSLAAFASRPSQPGELTRSKAEVAASLDRLTARGGTALYDSVAVALEKLRELPDPRAVVLLTDGRDEDASGKRAGSRATLAATLGRLREAGIPLYALGLGTGIDKSVLEKLAGASGGRAFLVPRASDLEAAYRALGTALRAQYAISYESTRATADGAWRAIRVEVARPGVTVEATKGYVASRDLLR